MNNLPPLNEKIWRPFVIQDLFEIFLPSGDTQADKCESGEIPLVSAGSTNNGICKLIRCGDEKSEIYDGNLISVDMFGKAFFHPYKFYCVSHGRVNLLRPRRDLNRYHFLFLCTSINKASKGKFSYNQMCSSKRIARLPIQLPIDDAGEPDYDFMEKYIRQVEAAQLQKYREVVSICPSSETIQPLSEKKWRVFFIEDLFRLETGKSKGLNHLEQDEHGIPYLGATNRNNGVLAFVRPVENLIQRGNCIVFIRNGEGSVGYSIYKSEDFIATSDITCGYADFLNKYVGMFITTVADKVRGKYSFNYKRSDTRLRREKLMLPVTDDSEPDFEYMENYIRNIEAAQYRKYLDYIGGD
jgi:hypothetical protein